MDGRPRFDYRSIAEAGPRQPERRGDIGICPCPEMEARRLASTACTPRGDHVARGGCLWGEPPTGGAGPAANHDTVDANIVINCVLQHQYSSIVR